jgi:hypothetical protein
MTGDPFSGFRDWWRRKAAAYALLWLWAGLGFALLPLFAQLHLADIFPGASTDRLLIGPLAWIHAHTGLRLRAQLWLAALVAWCLVGAIVVALEWLAWRLRVDRDDHAWTSLMWALRSWPAWMLWTTGVALVACLGWPLRELPGLLWLLAFSPAMLAIVTLPFFAFNAQPLLSDTPPVLWRWCWPGWPSVASVLAYTLVTASADKGIDLFGDIVAPGQRWIPLSLGLVFWVIALLWALVWQVAWLNRATMAEAPAMRRRALAAPVVSAAVVQDLRYWLLGALFAVPILAVAVATIFFIPQMVESLQYRGAELPAAWKAMYSTSRFVSKWWWFAIPPFAWFAEVASARLLVQLGTVDAIAARPATRPDSGPASTIPPTA